MTWFSFANSFDRGTSSPPSLGSLPVSPAVPCPEAVLESPVSPCLGLFVRSGFVGGELAGEAVFGGGLGC